MAFKTLYAAEDFDDLDEFFDCGSVDFFVVWRRFAKYKTLSQEKQSKAMMVISPIPGCFLVYLLNNEVKQTTRLFQSTDGDFSSTRVFPDVSFDSIVKQGKPIKSRSLSTYQDVDTDLSRNVRKQRNGLVWADMFITWHLLETSFKKKADFTEREVGQAWL